MLCMEPPPNLETVGVKLEKQFLTRTQDPTVERLRNSMSGPHREQEILLCQLLPNPRPQHPFLPLRP